MRSGQGLDFRLLGPLRMLRDGVELVIGGLKPRAVLAALLAANGRALTVLAISRAVWAESPPETVNAAVHVHISSLRRALTPTGSNLNDLIETTPAGYRLQVANYGYDLARFRRCRDAAIAARAAAQLDDSNRLFRQALAEWDGGPVLADLRDHGFAEAEAFAAGVEEELLTTLEARIEVDLAMRRHQELVGELTALTAKYPVREGLWAQLMVALSRCGRQSDALHAYKVLSAHLDENSGGYPSPAVRQLAQSIMHPAAPRSVPIPVPPERTFTDDLNDPPRASLLLAGGSRVPISTGGLRIGRDPQRNDLVLTDVKVSREHAVILDSAAGFLLCDIHSRHGTWLDGTRISESLVLHHGAEIKIGDTVLRFYLDGSA